MLAYTSKLRCPFEKLFRCEFPPIARIEIGIGHKPRGPDSDTAPIGCSLLVFIGRRTKFRFPPPRLLKMGLAFRDSIGCRDLGFALWFASPLTNHRARSGDSAFSLNRYHVPPNMYRPTRGRDSPSIPTKRVRFVVRRDFADQAGRSYGNCRRPRGRQA